MMPYFFSLFFLIGIAFHVHAEESPPANLSSEEEKLSFPTSGVTPDPDALDYGKIYVEEKSQLPWRQFRLGGSFGQEFGNPYLNTMVGSGIIEFSPLRYFWMGLQQNFYFSFDTPLLMTLRKNFAEQEIKLALSVPIPKNGTYFITTFVPLSGHFSFFSNRPLEVQLGLRIGIGSVQLPHRTRQMGILWSIRPGLSIADRWGVNLGFGQEILSPFKKVKRPFYYRWDLGFVFEF